MIRLFRGLKRPATIDLSLRDKENMIRLFRALKRPATIDLSLRDEEAGGWRMADGPDAG